MPDESHEAFEADFSDFYDRTVTEARAQEIEAHLASCARCKAEYERFRGAVGAVSGLGRIAAPRDFDDQVADTIRRRSAGKFFGRRAFGDRVPFEILAVLALVLVAAVYWFIRAR
jgi:anti-sigma factor RsiW